MGHAVSGQQQGREVNCSVQAGPGRNLGQTFVRSRRLQASRKERVDGKQRLPGKYWETRAGFGSQGYTEEGRAE